MCKSTANKWTIYRNTWTNQPLIPGRVDAHVCETLAQNADLTLRGNSEYIDRCSVHLL